MPCALAGSVVATNASASHAGPTSDVIGDVIGDVMATSSDSIEERWITPLSAATFLRPRLGSGASIGERCYLDTTGGGFPR